MGFEQYKRIHCLGIGGIGLSAVAEILADNGHIVTGTDINPSKVTRHLESIGIKVFPSHEPENVENVDAVVYSAAVANDNPEVMRARELGIPLFSRAEVLGMIMERYNHSVAICGTHGKTTVTSMTSLILRNAKYKPTILVGGNLPQINGNVEIGSNEYFVTEACEYMDSFLQLRPSIGVILNIDSDHLDYFKDMEHIVKSFSTFVEQITPDGIIIAYGDNPFVKSILKGHTNMITYGYSESNDYFAENIKFDENGFPSFDICNKDGMITRLQLSVPGEHNVLNAMAAFVTTSYLDVDIPVIAETLKDYHGTNRRFDFVGKTENGVLIIDDYAHHPTEIRATLTAAKEYPHDEIWTVFQPHTYTRTKAFLKQFADVLTLSDHVVMADIYAAREPDTGLVSSMDIVDLLKEAGTDVYYFPSFEEIEDFLLTHVKGHDLLITMGAGNVVEIGEHLLNR